MRQWLGEFWKFYFNKLVVIWLFGEIILLTCSHLLPNLFSGILTSFNIILVIVSFLLTGYYHFRIWLGSIELIDGTWYCSSWGYDMGRNPAIRDSELGWFIARFELEHELRSGNWAVILAVDENAVIQEYQGAKNFVRNLSFNPSLDDTGNHSFLCVRGCPTRTGRSHHLVKVQLMNQFIRLGAHIKFNVSICTRIDQEKCAICTEGKCVQERIRKIIDISALVTPPD